MKSKPSPSNEYVKLEERLVLADWAVHQLGYESNRAMLEDLKERDEGYGSSGESYVLQGILSKGAACKISRDDLERYDSNIKAHLTYFNRHRREPLTLRYFQHLSLLITERFLDLLFNHKPLLRQELNEFVEHRNQKRETLGLSESKFSDADLTKLAFWMATGSGKTILMHFNYRQFLHYNQKPLDNILLVTPDEKLSQQHIDNMREVGIPCARFNLENSGLETVSRNAVRVIEITKLVEQKRGSGVSVPVAYFQGNNLIFVDEGHRGASSEAKKWLTSRTKLAETGFTFEYSATFGQAMTAARNDEMTWDYGKAILFDYSYKYFFGDGFGKDFEVLNLKQETDEKQTRTLLLANLLSFFEQKRAFATQGDAVVRYHLADPLWIFVGSTVNTKKQAKESDVLTVVKFLDELLRNEHGWVQKTIEIVLSGKTGLEDETNRDLFIDRFKALKAWSSDPEKIQAALLRSVFNVEQGGGRLHVADIKGKAGELGLKAGETLPYFGLIYIGDTSTFKTLIETTCKHVTVGDDQIAEGLFENIKHVSSKINILIGAKKFIQGWDSWRVTNMGLLNIGRSEGSEIIQLFGRGVRLLGLGRKLRRSSSLVREQHPPGISLLEKLNIFAIRANYMVEFRRYLEREGVDPDGEVLLPFEVEVNHNFLKTRLLVPRLASEKTFAESERILIEKDQRCRVVLDFSLKVERLGIVAGALKTSRYVEGQRKTLAPDQLNLLNWEQLYLDMLQFKDEQGFHNLIVTSQSPREVLGADPPLYSLICDDSQLRPTDVTQLKRLQSMMSSVVKKYLETFYRNRRQSWESDRLRYEPLRKDDPNFGPYVVKVPRVAEDMIRTVRAFVTDKEKIYKEVCDELPVVFLDRHLYQPLLVKSKSPIKTSPPGLNAGEERFVRNLVDFCRSNPPALKGKELFLLRNLSRGKGIGFFSETGFYPDFLLWLVKPGKQRLVFVEPHGLLNDKHPVINQKITFHKTLQGAMASSIRKVHRVNFSVDSYVISVTPYDELMTRIFQNDEPWTREQFENAHVLFFDDKLKYLSKIISDGPG
jgi:Type III restriction enzyme, res subunit